MKDSLVGTPIDGVRFCEPNPNMFLKWIVDLYIKGDKISEHVKNISSYIPH